MSTSREELDGTEAQIKQEPDHDAVQDEGTPEADPHTEFLRNFQLYSPPLPPPPQLSTTFPPNWPEDGYEDSDPPSPPQGETPDVHVFATPRRKEFTSYTPTRLSKFPSITRKRVLQDDDDNGSYDYDYDHDANSHFENENTPVMTPERLKRLEHLRKSVERLKRRRTASASLSPNANNRVADSTKTPLLLSGTWTSEHWQLLDRLVDPLQDEYSDLDSVPDLPKYIYAEFPRFKPREIQQRALAIIRTHRLTND
uniref:ARAD1A17688p n=1 Tax=Blastobotrys adeninivorans TaxID=409370 RepID=A0A060SZ55_BLAAD